MMALPRQARDRQTSENLRNEWRVLSYRALYTQTQLLLELAGLEDDEATSVRERLLFCAT
jgi:hypothetical protein